MSKEIELHEHAREDIRIDLLCEDVVALTEHLRLKEEECKQLQQDNEKLTGKIADMAPVVSQANQWREEHLRTSKLLTQSNKDKAELVEFIKRLQTDVSTEILIEEMLERMKCD